MTTDKRNRIRDYKAEYKKRLEKKRLKALDDKKKPAVKNEKKNTATVVKEKTVTVPAPVQTITTGGDFGDILGVYQKKLDGDTVGDEIEVEEADIDIENAGEGSEVSINPEGEHPPKKYEKPVDGDALMMLVSFVFPIAVLVGVKVMSRGKKGTSVDDYQLKTYHEKMLEKLAEEAADELMGEVKRSTVFIVCLIAVYVSMVMEGLKAPVTLVPAKV